MAKEPKNGNLRGVWAKRIAQAQQKDYGKLVESGKRVVDQYRIEAKSATQQDKYNILYSITETIKPSMYSQTPKPEVKRRHIDRTNPIAIGVAALLESSIQYTIDEQDFDEVMRASVEDFLLPGLGVAWCRYQPTISVRAVTDTDGSPTYDDKQRAVTEEYVEYERVCVDFVLWRDFLTSRARSWAEVWWIARRHYLDKGAMLKQGIPAAIVAKVSFETKNLDSEDQSLSEGQAAVWEIWDKRARQVIWYTDAYPEDVLKVTSDFLKLEDFFPCPRPLRAVTTNNKFVPRPFFSQYQAQADELNDVTHRIRRLVSALRVVGVYDSSVPSLQKLLQGSDNRMVAVDNWSTMQDKGGIKGTIDFVPIAEIANVLIQLYDARERVKGEIYEITGWSDIIRGVSKASETLGAQQIKAEWAGARLKLLQKDVQRFVRDIFRIIGEIVAEHFSVEMLILMAGLDAEYIQKNPQALPTFKQVVELLRKEKDRCALIGIESDSTLLPDEANDRKDRMEFVGAAGAFLQQAVPAMQTAPQLAPVLGEILMFAVRSFRSARSLEQTFENFRQQIAANPPQAPDKGEGKPDNNAGQVANAQAKASDTQAKFALGKEANALTAQEIQIERDKETNRHAEKMTELELKAKELGIKSDKLVQDDQHKVLEVIDSERERQDAAQGRQEDRADAREALDRDSAERAADRAAAASGGESA